MELKRSPVTNLLEFLLKHRIASSIFLLIMAAISVPGLFHLDISVDINNFFVEKQEGVKDFQTGDFIGVLVESDDIYSRETLELIRRTGKILQRSIPLAKSPLSLTELENFHLGGQTLRFDGDILLSTGEEIGRIRRDYSDIPSIGGTLVSKDFKEAWIILQLEPYRAEYDQFEIGRIAWETFKSIDSGSARMTATGVPVYAYRKETEMMGDLTKVLIFGSLAALVLSALILRSFRGVAGAILVIAVSVLIVFGIQGWRETTIDSAFISVPILLTMGVSIGYTVHISRFFNLYFRKTGHRKDAVLYAVQESGKPILFTAFTTIAALFSFLFVEIRPIQWVGSTSALAITAVCILTLLFYPLLLSAGKDRDGEKTDGSLEFTARFEPFMKRIPLFLEKHGRITAALFILSVIISLAGIFRVEIDFNGVKMMGSRLPHMKDQIHIGQSEIASAETMEIIIRLNPGDFRKRENLLALESLGSGLEEENSVKNTHSLADGVKEFSFLRYGRDRARYTIPDKDSLTRGLLLYYERLAPEALSPWVTSDYGSVRLFVEMKDFSSKEIVALIGKTDELMKEYFPGDAAYYLDGSSYHMAVMNQYITRGLIRSVLTATGMITLLLIILFRSVKLGFIAMIPNIYPLLVCGAIMGFARIPMEFVTMTVAPMIMGLAVDDTIHFISHIRKDMTVTGNSTLSVRFAFSTVGSAITETTVILCLTFLVFLVSEVNSIKNMGIISASGMGAAYLADIFITPLLIRKFYSKGEM